MRSSCPECDAYVEFDASAEPVLTCPSCGTPLATSDDERLTETVALSSPRIGVVAHFELIRKLGKGSFGDVYLARDTHLDRLVALKLLRRGAVNEQSRELFLREGRAAGQLNHPNIVTVYGIGSVDETCYIVSAFIEGVPLSKYLESHRFEPREAAEFCASVADALAHAHNEGVVHRDLKPSNIMVDGRRQPHVMDFGMAKREAGDMTLTVEGQILGTLPYMPPEQARGKAHEADRRSDIYSLGVVLYELLAGMYPFRGSADSIIFQILNDEPRPPRQTNPAVPRDLETICLKALSKAPVDRYAKAEEMADDLRRFAKDEPIKARPAGRFERTWRWVRRNPGRTISAAAIGVLLAGVLSLSYGWRHANDPTLRTVHIATNPPGARAVCVPLDEFSGEPLPAAKVKLRGVTPGKVRLAPGEYLVVVDLEDYGFHEVYRRVPADGDTPGDFRPTANWTPLSDGSVALPAITIVPTDNATRGMEYFSGGRFSMGDNKIQGSPKHDRTVEGYWLDRTEVTVSRYQTICGGLPNSFHAAKAGAANRDYPITHVTFDQALNYAELSGKRLMTEAEYEFAATVGGTQRYPWGDSDDPLVDWTFGPVGEPAFDRLSNAPSVMGLYSNVAEWTDSRLVSYLAGTPIPDALRKLVPLGRVVRGGTADVVKGDPDAKDFRAPGSSGTRFRLAYTTTFEFPGLGFRCARSGTPRFLDD